MTGRSVERRVMSRCSTRAVPVGGRTRRTNGHRSFRNTPTAGALRAARAVLTHPGRSRTPNFVRRDATAIEGWACRSAPRRERSRSRKEADDVMRNSSGREGGIPIPRRWFREPIELGRASPREGLSRSAGSSGPAGCPASAVLQPCSQSFRPTDGHVSRVRACMDTVAWPNGRLFTRATRRLAGGAPRRPLP